MHHAETECMPKIRFRRSEPPEAEWKSVENKQKRTKIKENVQRKGTYGNFILSFSASTDLICKSMVAIETSSMRSMRKAESVMASYAVSARM